MKDNNTINMTFEETKEVENSIILNEREVTVSLTQYEELIRAEQKLAILCRAIYEANDYEAKGYRLIVGEKLLPLTKREIEYLEEEMKRREQIEYLAEEKARKQKEKGE